MRVLLVALLFAALSPAHSQAPGSVLIFDRAESMPGWSGMIPPDTVTWAAIALPHNWHVNPPAQSTWTWYRIRVPLAHAPERNYGIYLARLAVRDIAVYVNRRLVWQLTDQFSLGAGLTAGMIQIPPSLLQSGDNVIHIRVSGYPKWFHGLPRVHFGDSRVLYERAAVRNLFQGQMIYILAVALGAIGLLSLMLWLRSRGDPVLFWYGITGVGLLALTVLWYTTLWRDDLTNWRLVLVFLRYNGFLTPLMILHLRLAGRRHPWLECALWVTLAVACASIVQPQSWQAAVWTGWGLFFAGLPILFVLPLVWSRDLRREPTVVFLIVADVAAALLNLHDWAMRFGWMDYDRPYLVYYVAPFVILAAGVPILQRLFAGVDTVHRMNVELESRVAQKAREIEANHAKVLAAEHERTLSDERRRIMADMHDGLGSRLVALLSLAESGRVKSKELGEGIAGALDELRLAIDSLEPVEGDVGVVLGNVRHRMRSVLERAGVRFLWNVSELPRMDDLTPGRILAIQRILLEAITNSIKHAAAKTVAVNAVRVPGAVHVVIADDGRGFDADAKNAGRGLENLKLRASQAGGTLNVESVAGRGTQITLVLPITDESSSGALRNVLPIIGEDASFSPILGIPAQPPST